MATNNATMKFKDIQNYQMLLNGIFTQKLKQNEEQVKMLHDYKKRHEKVIEALKVFPLSLSMNCMVPIGKLALMKGKLTHTNEILVCLGDGYFAKYSASEAIALCNRRLAWTDRMLKDLEAERNLYEMRQIFPLQHDVFGRQDVQDILEHSNEEELNEWKVQHRQRVKDYRQKLIKEEKTDICAEEDLFNRLDELELQEEMEDEMWRLEAKQEICEEQEECIPDYNKITTGIFGEELNKPLSSSNFNFEENQGKVPKINMQFVTKNEELDLIVNSNQDSLTEICLSEATGEFKNTQKKKTVSFAESDIMKYEKDSKADTSTSQNACFMEQNDIYNDEDSENNDNAIRINFSHSCETPNVRASETTDIQSPTDIYRIFTVPKSILKKSPNMTSDLPSVSLVSPLNADTDTDTTDEDEDNWVIRDIKERPINLPTTDTKQNNKATDGKKITSKFKMERARIKNK